MAATYGAGDLFLRRFVLDAHAGEKQGSVSFQKSHKYTSRLRTFAMCDYSFCCARVSLPCLFHTQHNI